MALCFLGFIVGLPPKIGPSPQEGVGEGLPEMEVAVDALSHQLVVGTTSRVGGKGGGE